MVHRIVKQQESSDDTILFPTLFNAVNVLVGELVGILLDALGVRLEHLGCPVQVGWNPYGECLAVSAEMVNALFADKTSVHHKLNVLQAYRSGILQHIGQVGFVSETAVVTVEIKREIVAFVTEQSEVVSLILCQQFEMLERRIQPPQFKHHTKKEVIVYEENNRF